MDKCIPANPDISGIGVRAAIYAQNLLCFAPVVAHLWDGHISADEMRGVKDQSIGMLAIAFAILISTIIGATNIRSGQVVTNFHAAVILDLSWMNNTSTWIWFLLYVHHLTKPGPAADTEPKRPREPLPTSWSAWTSTLLSPVRRLVMDRSESNPDGASNVEEGTVSRGGKTVRKKVPVVQRAWNFVSKAPVLTLGSIHLSLMGAIGLWLWSNPSKFGTHINCDPTLTVIGGAVPFSSLGLRIFSLAIYCLLLIPGLNLVPPFLFFLALHITYNKSQKRHSHFWGQLDHLIGSIHLLSIFQDFHGTVQRGARALHSIPRSIRALFRRQHIIAPDLESGTQGSNPPSGHSLPVEPHLVPSKNHAAFLIVGLVSLGVINIILLVDIELTLRRNKRNQSTEEDQWGFGQTLALLLLVVPLRDFVTSILDIREKVKREKAVKEKVQKDFEEHLQQAVSNDSFEGHDFKALIQGGANPKVAIKYKGQDVTVLELSGSHGNERLVQFLLEKGVEDLGAKAFYAAARRNRFGSAHLLGKGRTKEERAETAKMAICQVVELLSDADVHLAALRSLSGLGVHATFQEEIRTAIPMVGESLKNSSWKIRQAALGCLSDLGIYATFQREIRTAIPMVAESLKDSNSDVQQAALDHIPEGDPDSNSRGAGITEGFPLDSSAKLLLGASLVLEHMFLAAFQAEIQTALPMVAESLKDSDWPVRKAALGCLSGLGAHATFQEEIQTALPIVAESLKDSDWHVRQAALGCLSGLGAHAAFQEEIRTAIPMVVESLKDSNPDVQRAAAGCLSGLGAHATFQQEIQTALPMVAESLKDSDWHVRQAALGCLSGLGAHATFQEEIQTALPMVAESLKDSNWHVQQAALGCLSGFGAHAAFQEEIRTAILMVVESLKDSSWNVRQAALGCLSGLGPHATFQREIRTAIPMVAESLKDSDSDVRQAALECLSDLGAHATFQEEIQTALPMVAESLKDSNWHVQQAALGCLSGFGAHAAFQEEIRTAILMVVESLKDSSWNVRQAALGCLSGLGAHATFQEEIQTAIPMVVESLKDSNPDVQRAAAGCLSGLGAHATFQREIRTALPMVAESLKDSDWHVRKAALGCLSALGAHATFQREIRTAIPMVAESLKDSDSDVRQAALECLSDLGAHATFQTEIRTAIPMVAESLKDFNSDVRQAALECLSGLGAPDCEIILITILSWSKVAGASTLETLSSMVQRVITSHGD
ncbi:armadillo-type protein [Mycena amicta]|nr:armadillo-type protein [Mycena amicta]